MSLPTTTRQLVVTTLGNKYREITEIREAPVTAPKPGHVVVQNKYVGINASDIIYSSGGYDPTHKPPLVGGLESLGVVAAAGEGVSLTPGQNVVNLNFGSFSDYVEVPADKLVPVPSDDPAMLSIILSGLTACLSLDELADLKPGKKVLVTAAAGGTGHIAVQLAALAGCHVIGTTSTAEKAAYLKSIGCNRVVNYNEEKLEDVLKAEYPEGMDVVYECIGQEMFDVALQNLAVRGRLIVIGAISNYQNDNVGSIAQVSKLPIASLCLRKSACVQGFFLPQFREFFPAAIQKLVGLYMGGKLKVTQDYGKNAEGKPFKGLDQVVDAVEYMYARRNMGKIVVQL